MENIIQAELAAAKEKMIEEIELRSKNRTLAKLTRDNVAIVEAMIRNDSAYINSTNKEAEPEGKYGGSSAFWMIHLKGVLLEGKTEKRYSYKEILTNAIMAVDRENSTHLNADKTGREEIAKRLVEFDRSELIKCLKYPDYEDMKLIREISRRTSAKQRARTNLSFASKFCHYACFYLFEGTEYQDNYSIYDSILRTVLPWYMEYYGIDASEYDLNEYKSYRDAVDKIREASGIAISRNGFDHLLWYYHKGRLRNQ